MINYIENYDLSMGFPVSRNQIEFLISKILFSFVVLTTPKSLSSKREWNSGAAKINSRLVKFNDISLDSLISFGLGIKLRTNLSFSKGAETGLVIENYLPEDETLKDLERKHLEKVNGWEAEFQKELNEKKEAFAELMRKIIAGISSLREAVQKEEERKIASKISEMSSYLNLKYVVEVTRLIKTAEDFISLAGENAWDFPKEREKYMGVKRNLLSALEQIKVHNVFPFFHGNGYPFRNYLKGKKYPSRQIYSGEISFEMVANEIIRTIKVKK